MKNHLRFSIPLLIFCVVCAGQLASYSSGPPPGNSGAPGNNTCASAGCHNSFPLNSGNGDLTISTNIPEAGFLPGERYTVTVRMKEDSRTIFGFQTLPYGESAQQGVGTIQLTDTERTRTITASGNTYAEQTKTGSSAADSAVWSFDWIAPQEATGDVTLYTAAIAANGNGNRQGDRVYTTSLRVSENPTASLEELREIATGTLFPNPFSDQIHLAIELSEPTPIHWTVVSIDGRMISFGETSTLSGTWNKSIDLSAVPAGLYSLEVRTQSGRWTEKILKR